MGNRFLLERPSGEKKGGAGGKSGTAGTQNFRDGEQQKRMVETPAEINMKQSFCGSLSTGFAGGCKMKGRVAVMETI